MRYCPACKSTFLSSVQCPRDGVRLTVEGGDPLLGHVLGDRYRVLERIAAGGMGQVYRATHARIATLFAVKVLYGELANDPSMRRRFESEAEAASCLQSRYITRVFDFGETEQGLLYLVMELVEGPPLSGLITREGRIAPARAAKLARQVAIGLSHAHERGIVHRDLKPENVMLATEDDGEEVAKILDFGIARVRERSGMTQVGSVLGTPEYMAPEQFIGSAVDLRADLYALGVMLYEMLSGKQPYAAGSPPELFRLHSNGKPAPLTADVPQPLPQMVQRLMSPSVADRPASARVVFEALGRLSLPVSVPAPAAVAAARAPTTTAVARLDAVDRTIREAIQRGVPLYNSGNSAGCAGAYRDAAELLVSTELAGAGQEALKARLTAALKLSAPLEPAAAAWELRHAFDDVLSALRRPVPTLDVPPALQASPDGAQLAQQIELCGSLAAARLEAGQRETVAAYYAAFVEALRLRLARVPGCAPAVRALEEAQVRASAGGLAALRLGEALDAIRSRTGPTTAPAPSAPPVPRPSTQAQSTNTAEELGEAADLLIRTISIGAPLYNAGDLEGCARLYRDAARRLAQKLAGNAGATLRQALTAAEGKSPDDAAWTFRRAFDALLDVAQSASTR